MICQLCRLPGHSIENCRHMPKIILNADNDILWNITNNKALELGKQIKNVLHHDSNYFPFSYELAILTVLLEDDTITIRDRSVCFAALQYFMKPFDAIPDAIPFIGYTDDAIVLFMALSIVLDSVSKRHDTAAKELLSNLQKSDHE